ncbi:DUF1102 domain-containing protein [Halomicrobium salinisoli]|uniref:DUF1102 domain-containing protein n=1 Tax=Halomicrobium salinisoli TaxID=2878391 RepID=UPI001CEFFFF9|nr:DUF1102 domain-containing protein [Halomicrobium salinisoli]
MERRKFIATVGSLAAGSAAAVGTGAFTSVTASRDVDVEVADDASAYLRLQGAGGPNAEYVTDDGNGGTLAIDLSSNNATSAGGQGVNLDAITQIDELFVVENQGTQEVEVTIDKNGSHSDLVEFHTTTDYNDEIGSSSGNGVTLGAGDSATVSVEIDTEGESLSSGDQLLDSVTFNADAT